MPTTPNIHVDRTGLIIESFSTLSPPNDAAYLRRETYRLITVLQANCVYR
jgi:hypothetical protein